MERLSKESYLAPTAEIVLLENEGSLLQASIQVTRQSYGEGIEEDWT